jgi:hypothetical protein
MMEHFCRIDNAYGIFQSKGIFRQLPLYRLGELVFAEVRSGQFIRLQSNSATTDPAWRWEEVDVQHAFSPLGRMVFVP